MFLVDEKIDPNNFMIKIHFNFKSKLLLKFICASLSTFGYDVNQITNLTAKDLDIDHEESISEMPSNSEIRECVEFDDISKLPIEETNSNDISIKFIFTQKGHRKYVIYIIKCR